MQLFEQAKSINKSALNKSLSKAMYSFSKSPRFLDQKAINDTFYDSVSMLDKRATSMGFGKKTAINDGFQKTPSPDKYVIQGTFSKSPKKGVSFGAGREDVKFISIFNKNKNPGPGVYQNQKHFSSKQYSMRAKINFPQLFKNYRYPGPGTYDLQMMGKDGRYLTSKNKNNISYRIHQSPRKGDDKQNMDQQVHERGCNSFYSLLGPGSYNIGYSSNGKQFLSKKKSEQANTFAKRTRQTLSLSLLAPGPGTYESFSEFGNRV